MLMWRRERGRAACNQAHLVLQEVVHLGGGPVVGDHLEAVVVHVEDEVLAHDGQPDEGDVGVSLGHLADCRRVAHWFQRLRAAGWLGLGLVKVKVDVGVYWGGSINFIKGGCAQHLDHRETNGCLEVEME